MRHAVITQIIVASATVLYINRLPYAPSQVGRTRRYDLRKLTPASRKRLHAWLCEQRWRYSLTYRYEDCFVADDRVGRDRHEFWNALFERVDELEAN